MTDRDYTVDPATVCVVWDWVKKVEVTFDPQIEADSVVTQLLAVEWPSEGMARAFANSLLSHARYRISRLEQAREEVGEQILTLTQPDELRDKKYRQLADLRSNEGGELWTKRMCALAQRAESLSGELRFYELVRQMVKDVAAQRGWDLFEHVDNVLAPSKRDELVAWAMRQAGLTVPPRK